MRCLLIFLFLLANTPAHGALKVTIDPGHGGPGDRGAVYAGVVESSVALQISKKLYRRLRNDKNFQVQILRKDNSEISLENRVEKSHQFSSDLFLSIHANANPNPRARGVEFYIQNQLAVDQETLFLAHQEHIASEEEDQKPKGDVESIIFDLEKSHKILTSYQVSSFLRKSWSDHKARMIRQGPFYVLSHNQIPSVLVEVGYLSHPKERRRLTQNDYQLQIAKKIHLALKDYAKNMDKLPSGILKPQDAKTR